MSKAAMNLQDSFLNQVRRDNSEVHVLLVNGKSLRGSVKGFDNFTVILNSRSGQHLIYKHAIAQLVSQKHLGLKREGDEMVAAGSEDHTADESPASDSPAPEQQPKAESHTQQHARPHQGGGRREDRDKGKARKDGFNTLDLSKVKLGEGEQPAVSTESQK